MREIKFRGFDPKSGQMHVPMTLQQIKQVLIKSNAGEALNLGIIFSVTFDDLIFTQYTSLKDKQGKEIYESDVIEDHFGHIWTVVFQDGCFWLYRKGFRTTNQMMSWPVDCYPMFRVDHSKYSKVIGNTHQNPELCQ